MRRREFIAKADSIQALGSGNKCGSKVDDTSM